VKVQRVAKLEPVAAAPASKQAQQSPRRGVIQAWHDLWFTPVAPTGLHVVRVAAGLLFIGWLLSYAGQIDQMLSMEGWFDRQAYMEASRMREGLPVPIGWSLLYAVGTNTALVHGLYWGALGVLGLFTLGLATRITGALTWVLVVSFFANPATRSEADYLVGILAFYLMIAYLLLGQWSCALTPVERLLGPRGTWVLSRPTSAQHRSYAANLAMRLLQVHFVIIVVTSGLHKLQLGPWWGGVAFWYPLHSPYETTEAGIRALAKSRGSYLLILSLVQYIALAWQIGFPLFAWRAGICRIILIVGAAIGWLGCWMIYHAPAFGPFYLVCSLSFVTPEEWHRLVARLAQMRRSSAATHNAPVRKDVTV
jgi:hypothetical protein